MMRRSLVAVALAVACLASTPGRAAVKLPKILFADAAGDANGINDQGVGPAGSQLPPDGRVLPAQIAANLDVLGVGFSTDWAGAGKKRKPSILNLRVQLAGEPGGDNVARVYRVFFDTPRCGGNMAEWEFVPSLPSGVPDNTPGVGQVVPAVYIVTHFLHFVPGGECKTAFADPDTELPLSVVSGKNLIYRIPLGAIFRTTKSTAGNRITGVRVEARLRPRNAYAYPIADVASNASKVYVVGK